MASIDNSSDYEKIKGKIKSVKSYNDLKGQYKDAKKRAGDSFEDAKDEATEALNKVKGQTKKFQKDIKNQFEELLELLKMTATDKVNNKIGDITSFGNNGSNTVKYIKRTLLKTLKNIEPKILEILMGEILKALGCDQQQTFTQQTIYIKVKSIDLSNLLKLDPKSKTGMVLYERNPISIQSRPFSMNRELFHRIEKVNQTFNSEYSGRNYKGASGQDLFDIKFIDNHPITGESGGWFAITLFDRINGPNKVIEFMTDYYKSIKLFEYHDLIASIINQLFGAISINASFGMSFVTDAKKFERILMRILGLCFDNKKEIDVSGVSKIAESDGVDDSFFEFTDLDLRLIERDAMNVKNGVVEFENCGNVKLPVDSNAILDALSELLYVDGAPNEIDIADNITNSVVNGPDWNGVSIQGNVQAEIDFNFIKLIIQGLIVALLSPKVLLPIFIMLKSLGNNLVDAINSFMEFTKQFSKFVINLVSKIGAVFVKELFELLKKDIKNLLQQIILDVAKEKADKRITMVLKLIQLTLVVAEFIRDWRRCKSVIDEIFWLLKIATTGWGGEIPLPLLFGSRLLDGYSESRAFLNAVEEMQKVGIPTGTMPDGSPNFDILSKFAQMKGMSNEEAENGKVQVGIPLLTVLPSGQIPPISLFGKKI